MNDISKRMRNYAFQTYVDEHNDRIPILAFSDEVAQVEAERDAILEALQAVLWSRSPDELDEASKKAKAVVEAIRKTKEK